MKSNSFCCWNQNPGELDDWLSDLNPESKVVIQGAYAVSSLKNAAVGDRFQFERLGKSGTPHLFHIETKI